MGRLLLQTAFIACLCFCTLFVPDKGMCAQARKIDPAAMQKHIEEMKRKNPAKYQMMIQKAGGNVTTCTDCHKI